MLWGGGIWNWFDPLTVIRAVGRLAEARDDVKLLFLGLTHPSGAVGEMTMADQAVALAAELGLDGRSVFFNRAWVPYDERLAWFAEAAVGVSAHRESLESRLAFRTRLLDHIACGTPLVVTGGDVLADLVQARGMGRVVAAGDVDGWTDALAELLDDDHAHAAASSAATAAQDELSWTRIGDRPGGADRAGRLVAPPALVGERSAPPRRGDRSPLVVRAPWPSRHGRRRVAGRFRRQPALV